MAFNEHLIGVFNEEIRDNRRAGMTPPMDVQPVPPAWTGVSI